MLSPHQMSQRKTQKVVSCCICGNILGPKTVKPYSRTETTKMKAHVQFNKLGVALYRETGVFAAFNILGIDVACSLYTASMDVTVRNSVLHLTVQRENLEKYKFKMYNH